MNPGKQAADREAVKENSQGQARVLRAAPGRAPKPGLTLQGSKNDVATMVLQTILAPFQGAPVWEEAHRGRRAKNAFAPGYSI
jgi:hypothetical protein